MIGVVAPLSGPSASLGREVKRGADLAATLINRRGGVEGKKVRIAFRDDSDYSRIVGLLRDLVQREEPVAVIGPEDASALLSSNNPISRARIPALSFGAFGDMRSNPYLFRLVPSNSHAAQVAVSWLTAVRSIRRIAIARSQGPWGADGAAQARQWIEKAGAAVTTEVELLPGAVDLTPQAQALRASGADAVVVWAPPADAARVRLAIGSIDWSAQVVGTDVLFSEEFRSLTGTTSDNVALVMPRISEEEWFGRELRDWFVEYHKEFTILPIDQQRTLVSSLPLHALTSFDAVNMIVDALGRAESNEPEELRKELGAMRFEGVVHDYAFSSKDREAFAMENLAVARFFNLALLYDVEPGADIGRQIAFYKVQVSGFYVPDEYLESEEGKKVADRVLEDVLTNPEQVEFFKPYAAPRPPPGPL